MPISDDITAVLQEVGTSYSVYKPDGSVITGEFLDFEAHPSHTTPMIRAFMYDFTLPSGTSVEVGDVIEFAGKKVMVLVMAPEFFEDAIVDYLSSGYVSNTVGRIQYYDQDGGWDANYDKQKTWQNAHANDINAVLMDRLFRSNVKAMGDGSSNAELDRLHLYLHSSIPVEMGNRWYVSDTESYKVEQIEPYTFLGVNLVFLAEDKRS